MSEALFFVTIGAIIGTVVVFAALTAAVLWRPSHSEPTVTLVTLDDGQIIPLDWITAVRFDPEWGSRRVHVTLREPMIRNTLIMRQHWISDFRALELVWLYKPGALEGNRRVRWPRHAWIVHNVVAHPLMQLLALFGFHRLAIQVHDSTVPKPIGFK